MLINSKVFCWSLIEHKEQIEKAEERERLQKEKEEKERKEAEEKAEGEKSRTEVEAGKKIEEGETRAESEGEGSNILDDDKIGLLENSPLDEVRLLEFSSTFGVIIIE